MGSGCASRLKKLKNMYVANVFYALGACKYQNPATVEKLMDEAMDPDRLSSFTDFDVATIVGGMGGMGVGSDMTAID